MTATAPETVEETSPTQEVVVAKTKFNNLEKINVKGLDDAFWDHVANAKTFSVRQHIKLLPKCGCRCPPCVKKTNTYSVFQGKSFESQDEFLRIDEVSNDWNRCCCNPYQPFKLEVRKYLPIGKNRTSEFAHFTDDFYKELESATKWRKAEMLSEVYMKEEPIFTILRNDGMRCGLPCKCLSTFVCFSFCQDGVTLFAGPVDDENEEKGRNVHNLPLDRRVGTVVQPIFGGCCIPVLDVYDNIDHPDSETPWASVKGACCFGGWSEMCFPFKMEVLADKDTKFATLKKTVPSDITTGVKELFTQADNYTISFEENVTPTQKLTLLSSQILADYMWFENSEKCEDKEDYIQCNLCMLSIVGATCPFCIPIPKKSS